MLGVLETKLDALSEAVQESLGCSTRSLVCLEGAPGATVAKDIDCFPQADVEAVVGEQPQSVTKNHVSVRRPATQGYFRVGTLS